MRESLVRVTVVLVIMSGVVTLGEDNRAMAQAEGDRRMMAEPDVKDVSYGPHERNKLDLYLARSDRPTPLVVFYHGGGFRQGDKVSKLPQRQLQRCLENGISYAAVNYRLTDAAPYPAQMHDAARALQFLRANAEKWNLDPARVAATGGSAGAGISQWLAYRDDLADPSSDDPVARQSTRLSCVMVFNAQCTYDPRVIKQIVPGDAHQHVALKRLFDVQETFDWDKDPIDADLDARLRDCGPLSHLTADDPPVMIVNNRQAEKPGNIHHPNFGRHLKQEMDRLGIECVHKLDTDFGERARMFDEAVEFFQRHFGMLGEQ